MSEIMRLSIALIVAFGPSTLLAENFPDPQFLNAESWPEYCRSTRAYLGERPYADMKIEADAALNSLGDVPLKLNGLELGLPFEPNERLDVGIYDRGGSVVVVGPYKQHAIVDIRPRQFEESYWVGDDVRSLSDRVFGARLDLDQFYYDSFTIGTKDIVCSVETMFEDAKQLAMIKSKLVTGLKGTKISEIFAIRSDVWTGYVYCYGDQQYKVLDFFAFSKDHSVIGGVKFRGECKKLR